MSARFVLLATLFLASHTAQAGFLWPFCSWKFFSNGKVTELSVHKLPQDTMPAEVRDILKMLAKQGLVRKISTVAKVPSRFTVEFELLPRKYEGWGQQEKNLRKKMVLIIDLAKETVSVPDDIENELFRVIEESKPSNNMDDEMDGGPFGYAEYKAGGYLSNAFYRMKLRNFTALFANLRKDFVY